MGEVQDIAQSTVFLFSEGATYISGVVLVVDGKINKECMPCILIYIYLLGGAWLNPSYPAYPDIVISPPDFKL
jgi:peroxisomal 2,4-dienoyl-CoA reductase